MRYGECSKGNEAGGRGNEAGGMRQEVGGMRGILIKKYILVLGIILLVGCGSDFELLVDLDSNSLLGVKLGDSSESLSSLKGKGQITSTHFLITEGNVEIGLKNQKIDYFLIQFANPDFPEQKSFAGRFLKNKTKIQLSPTTKMDQFEKIFPEPYWEHSDEKEIVLFYEFQNLEWQVKFNKKKKILSWLISITPLLNDPTQRKILGVTNNWPPY